MTILEELENQKNEERKKYHLDEEKTVTLREKIKKVSEKEANTIAIGLFSIIRNNDFNDSDDEMLTTVKYLIESGANLNYKDQNGNAILTYSVKHELINVISILLMYGADPNITESSGITPVGIASGLDNIEILRLLIYNGANINKRFENGETAINETISKLIDHVSNPECLEILLQHNAIINNTDLCNRGLKDINGLEYFGVEFQEKRKKNIDYKKLLDDAKSHLTSSLDEKPTTDVKKRTFKRIQ